MELGVALNRLPGLPLPRCNEAQGWCAVCRDPRLEDSFQARACIDDLKEVSAAIVKCGTGLTTIEFGVLGKRCLDLLDPHSKTANGLCPKRHLICP